MEERDRTQQPTRRVAARRRPPFVFALLAAVLFVPIGVSSSTLATDDVDDSTNDVQNVLADENAELVGGLIRISDPAPLGPFAAEGLGGDGPESTAEAAPTFGEAFTLHSRPAASRKILLDFDGQFVNTPLWNGGQPIDAAAYSRGSDQSNESFSAVDLAEIATIWRRVSEDFAAWDVDVTTEDPGAAGLARNGTGDSTYGVRVVITPSYEWYSSNRYGGTAYLRTFDRSEDLPAWVFSANLANGNGKSVAEAVSHEVGHTLGLSHDGITTANGDGTTTNLGYYSGHGDWAPIMGVGYYRPITQWSQGDYPGATEQQNDLAIIDSYVPRLLSGSGVLGPNDSTSTFSLTKGGETDRHSLQIKAGSTIVTVKRADADGNLLARLRVRNASGAVVASADPTTPNSWSLKATLPAGTPAGLYTVEIQSIGWTPSGDPGFTSYGSMGDYVLSIDAPDSADDSGTTTTTPGATTTPTTPTPVSQTPTPPPTPRATGDRLTAVTPRRVVDTREAGALVTGPLPTGRDTVIAIDGIPSDTTAVVVNVTAVAPRSAGYFSLTPCGVPDDARSSSLNFAAGRNIANSVIVPVSADGDICLFSSVSAHALLDLTGWIGASGELSLDRLGSARIVDTRDGTGISRRLPAGVRTPISLASILQSDTIDAVALNVTAIRPSANGFLSIDDCSPGKQPTSSLNFAAGEVRGNNGVFALGSGQQLCITSSSETHLTIDVTGDFGTGAGLTFVPNASSERVLDTRSTSPVAPGGTTTFDVDTAVGANSLASSPVAASINLTATRHDGSGFVTAWSCGERPSTSALNTSAGTATANGALVGLSRSGTTCLFHASGGHLIVDLAGWWI